MKKQWFDITEVTENLFALREPLHIQDVVSYLLVTRTNAILFDTGMGYENIEAVVKSLTQNPITVFLTHTHWDHIGGAHLFDRVNVFDNRFERTLLEEGFSSIDERKVFGDFLDDPEYFSRPEMFAPKKYLIPGKTKYGLLSDNQSVRIDDYDIQVIHTPGHTPGSACYYIPQLNVLLTGDLVYPGPLYAHLEGADFTQYLESLRKLSRLMDPSVQMLPGHNAVTVDGSLLKRVTEGFEAIAMGDKSQVFDPRENSYEYKFQDFSVFTTENT
jgi:glyoxylase-like metal-dependent hydrolase (beta-lactamase superfamily II)